MYYPLSIDNQTCYRSVPMHGFPCPWHSHTTHTLIDYSLEINVLSQLVQPGVFRHVFQSQGVAALLEFVHYQIIPCYERSFYH